MARGLLLLALVGTAYAVSPVEKVISLLEDLKTEVTNEGTAEATAYDTFACFCKTQTTTKAASITKSKDDIETASTQLEVKTAEKVNKQDELGGRKTDQEAYSAELQEETLRCVKEKAEYEATNADLSKAIAGLKGAIKALGDTGGTQSTVTLLEVRKQVSKSLALAEAMSMISLEKHDAVAAFFQRTNFLQGATSGKGNPKTEDYEYHSQGIVDTLEKLHTEFTAEKSDVDTEWAKTKTNCQNTKTSLGTKISANKNAMDQLDTDISTLAVNIATYRSTVVQGQSDLKDDEVYMKDLTKRCEERANDWDQRSQMRGDEITALSEALTIISNKVKGKEANRVNSTVLLTPAAPKVKLAKFAPVKTTAAKKVLSFLQLAGAQQGAASQQVRQDKIVKLLRQEGGRLHSTVLSAMAMHAAANPFGKVKDLIQKLIERLVNEATSEATKKGFCDAELGKAEKDREYRINDVNKLNVDLQTLEAKRDELDAEITTLGEDIRSLDTALINATSDRQTETVLNRQTIKDSRDGLEAVSEAITVLKVFYKQAAKSSDLLQASPVDDDTTGAGFSGSYSGKQSASKGILGLLDVIKADFERSLRKTTEAEENAASEFVEFDRTSKADIASKTMKVKLDEEDLVTTKDTIDQKMSDLKESMNLVDSAVERLEELKPTCIDTGMSYADRVAKRNEEVTALTKAHCLLTPDKEESDCDPAPALGL